MIEQAPRSGELLERVTRQEWEMIGDLRDLFERHTEVRVQDKDTARLEDELVAMITGYLRATR
ncbi:hypothetical protein [Actinomadura rubrisoli]|uniref:hypothetical protein n=1 Tax=Actinomadura rubrisoli TaxID=2530368 RepID=UPI001A9F112B|nr:hypothetical protein [Actinomadura rubrisoli]